MIEQFVDEDDFIINLDFDNQLGHFELTLQYWKFNHNNKEPQFLLKKGQLNIHFPIAVMWKLHHKSSI